MKKCIALLATCLIAASAAAASDAQKNSATDKSGAAKTGQQGKQAESSGDTPELKEKASGHQAKTKGKPATGSATGETGGPAATKGHTGSTTNTSNSPTR